jgi:hypothetical protein
MSKKGSGDKKEAAKPSDVSQQIGQKKLRTLLRAANDAHKDQREIAGGLGQKIADAVENEHLHKKAFSTLRMADRMTPEKLADWWDTLQYYIDVSGLAERAASAPRLRLEPDAEEDDADKGKVTPIRPQQAAE